jgi:hypothetical protein
MIDFIKRLLGFSAKPVEAAPEANQVAPYNVPEPAATTPIPLLVESAPAKPKAPARTAKPRAPAKAKAPAKAPAKPRATKAKPQA